MELSRLRPDTRPYLDLTFPPAPSDERPYVIINMVGSIDGKAVIGSSERGLGSAADKQRMQELRAHADVVLNGWGGLGVLVAWILLALIPALVLVRRRDA